MPIRLLIVFIVVLASLNEGFGQRFPNRNLYDIWIVAGEHLDKGRFDDAIKLYEVAPAVPEFAKRLSSAKRIQTIFQAGERYYRAKRYPEALEAFSRYRSIDPTLQVDVLDARIMTCLQELDKKLAAKLDATTRVVAGFEWAYKGEQQLAVLDTLAAKRSFTKAKQLGGGLNTTLREQYQQGLRSVKTLGAWGNAYHRAVNKDGTHSLETMKAYRSASKYIISDIEYEIKSVEEGAKATLSASSNIDIADRLRGYAEQCRIEDLYYFIKNNRNLIPDSDSLSVHIEEYRRVEWDVERLKNDPANRPFLESAFASLLKVAEEIPQIGKQVLFCARKNYSEDLIEAARVSETQGDEGTDNEKYQEAIGYIVKARTLHLSQFEAQLDEIQTRLSVKLECKLKQQEFAEVAPRIRTELSNCRIVEAWQLWEPAKAKLAGCGASDPEFFGQYQNLQDMVYRFHRADSLFRVLNPLAEKALAARQCGQARQLFQKIGSLDLCDFTPRDQAMAGSSQRIAECERVNCYLVSRDKAFQSAENRDWKNAYDAYQVAYDCAEESQKVRIKKIMADMKCDAYPDSCRKGNVSTALHPTGRVAFNNPVYFDNGLLNETNFGYFVSTGLQVSFLSYLNPVDVVIGAEYFRTKYSVLSTTQGQSRSAGDFEVEGADAFVALKLHKPNTDPNKLRPYLKGGIEMLLPFGYSLTNHDMYEATSDRRFLKKQSLGATAGFGIEMEKKKFGFFVEAVFGYNFSGIYNSNFVTSSGSRGKTEANFRTAGLRAGIRFW
ncbi:hypothetical protein [Persicitalea jodogahamensis]|uniref:Uncharacterized protein n=1 Tax=Persicitalea jodogahamensis TaxID=402147 RepID=A0A8J3DBZ6_9BACT|nr:hypothetical protein [Persicitalea jodogahamensis]GHB81099.1 hypothetical protein GCM10007390_39750 [Persicitalea jodogahamensis]